MGSFVGDPCAARHANTERKKRAILLVKKRGGACLFADAVCASNRQETRKHDGFRPKIMDFKDTIRKQHFTSEGMT